MNKKLIAFFALLLTPIFAYAHSGGEHLHSFAEGFSHPFSGIDHIIAMVAVGVWAKQRGGKNIFLLPLTFVLVMTLAALVGITGVEMSCTETGIMASNAVLIALVLISYRFSTAVSMAIVGFFALFHGISHGAEMPVAIESLSYIGGFISATSLLHGIGGLFGSLWTKRSANNGIVASSL